MAWPKEQIGCASERTHLPSPAFEFVLKEVGSLVLPCGWARAGTISRWRRKTLARRSARVFSLWIGQSQKATRGRDGRVAFETKNNETVPSWFRVPALSGTRAAPFVFLRDREEQKEVSNVD
jgi:hypothetical protein